VAPEVEVVVVAEEAVGDAVKLMFAADSRE
jgi:hypothetical protein